MEMLQVVQPLLAAAEIIEDGMVWEASPRKIKLLKDTLMHVERTGNHISKAIVQLILAKAFRDLSRRKEEGDIEECITLYTEALQVFTREATPYTWAVSQYELGMTYSRLRGEENREHALFHYENALQVLSQAEYPDDWAMLQLSLGQAYARSEVDEDLKRAIKHYENALEVLRPDTSPLWWAWTMMNLTLSYSEAKNKELALNTIDRALELSKDELLPVLPMLYVQMLILKATILHQFGRWADMHTTLQAARDIWSNYMVDARMTSMFGFVAEIKSRYIYHGDVAALLNFDPPDLEGVVIALEEGRAQVQRLAFGLNSIEPSRIKDPIARTRAEVFVESRDAWRAAQKEVDAPLPKGLSLTDAEGLAIYRERVQHVHKTYNAFKEARDAIRAHDDPDLLSPRLTFKDIARTVSAEDEALVYLVAGGEVVGSIEDGMAVIVTRNRSGTPEVHHLSLPQLSSKKILSMLMAQEITPYGAAFPGFDRYFGGYYLAQLGAGFTYLQRWGESLYETLAHLPPESSFALAVQQLVTEWKDDWRRVTLVYKSFDSLIQEERQMLRSAFNRVLLNTELEKSLRALGELGLDGLVLWLREQGKRKVSIVPYGWLGFFPFPAVLVPTKEGEQHLGDLFEVTITPSARALEIAKNRAAVVNRKDRLILAVGNPQPLPRGVSSLEYSEAEAQSIEQIAEMFGTGPVCCLTRERATRKAVLQALPQAWMVHLSMHGHYQADAPRQSRLLLAGGETVPELERTITLGECLSGDINLKEVRLLVLSACETSIIDIEQADEVVGIAAGFLQAGAAGVIATHWAVYDYPTCLLMSRFMQLYLDPDRKDWSPARCLAEAQRWLREEATYTVLSTYNPTDRVPLTPRSTFSKSTVQSKGSSLHELEASQERSLHSSLEEVLTELHSRARIKMQDDPQGLPYQDPIYWAAFTVTGC